MNRTTPEGSPGWLSEIFVSHQGEGAHAGERHLFVRLAGCNLRCTYCDTPESLVRVGCCEVSYPDGVEEKIANPISAAELARVVARCCQEDPRIAMIAITGGEPMVQSAFLVDWLERHPPARPCLLETNATITTDLDRVLAHIAVVSADVKLPSNSGERALWDEHRRFLEACANNEVYVKMPVDRNTDVAEVRRGASLVAALAPRATLFVQPVTSPVDSSWCLSEAQVLELVAAAQSALPTTRLRPQLHKLVGIR